MRHSFTFAVSLAALLAASSPRALPGGTGPSAEIEPMTVDFGRVTQGETVELAFDIGNSGDAPLKIQRMELGLPGMRVGIRQEIAPGSIATASMTWDTSGYSGPAEAAIVLYLNDPDRPRAVVNVQGTVVAPIEILPRPAFYLSQFAGEQSSGSLLLRNNQDRAVNVRGLERGGEHFTARVDTEVPGKAHRITVSVPDHTPPGRYRQFLTVLTDDPNDPKIHVEVNFLVKTDVFANPESIDFGTLSLSRLRSDPDLLRMSAQTSMITARQGAFLITSIHSGLAHLETRLDPESGPAEAYRLEIAVDPDARVEGEFDGEIVVETDVPDFPRLVIPVRGRIEA